MAAPLSNHLDIPATRSRSQAYAPRRPLSMQEIKENELDDDGTYSVDERDDTPLDLEMVIQELRDETPDPLVPKLDMLVQELTRLTDKLTQEKRERKMSHGRHKKVRRKRAESSKRHELEMKALSASLQPFLPVWEWRSINADGTTDWHAHDAVVSNQIEALDIGEIRACAIEEPEMKSEQVFITRRSEISAVQVNAYRACKENETLLRQVVLRRRRQLRATCEFPWWWNIEKPDSCYAQPTFTPQWTLKSGDDVPDHVQTVKEEFELTATMAQIVEIYAVQNPRLYDRYMNVRDVLLKSNVPHNERSLWHGTAAPNSPNPSDGIETMNIIASQGFRKEFTTQAIFGEGTYFAVDAAYSVPYSAKDEKSIYSMFYCKVMCGESVQGNPCIKLRSWPLKRHSNFEIVDSLTGMSEKSMAEGRTEPDIYVIHDDVRAYPLFVVRFVLRSD